MATKEADRASTAKLMEVVAQAAKKPVDPLDVPPSGVRYATDADFRRCLIKVMTTHERLLAKLAE